MSQFLPASSRLSWTNVQPSRPQDLHPPAYRRLDAVLSAITEICDLNAERAAVNDCNVILAKCWASAQSHINEAQTLLAPLNL